MADNKKIYTIQINGIEQSIKQVDALSDALKFLDANIKELESKKVNLDIDTTTKDTSSKDSSRISDLQTEDKLLKQIKNTEEQIANARREDYARLQAEKDILKEITNEQKKRAAAERLTANNYSNTMAGMKQELADVKTVRNFTDVTSQEFDKLTQRALQLTNQVKELEEETGQFGRNVGNYGNSMQQVNIQVGNTVRTFANAREASRVLNMELKSMALNGQKGSEAYEELDEAVKKLNSDLKDVTKSSQAMDDLLDTMESFTALGSIGTGFSALFGFDNDEIQKSIQSLMALQNILKGIETIRQQMKTGEGLGDLLSRGSDRIDNFVAGITGAKKGAEGLTMASKTATLAVRGLSLALEGIGIGLAIEAINLLMKGI
jgi:chromosome segregation ATPase